MPGGPPPDLSSAIDLRERLRYNQHVTDAEFQLLLERRDALDRRHRRWLQESEDSPGDARACVRRDEAASELAAVQNEIDQELASR